MRDTFSSPNRIIRTVFFDFYGTLVKWAPDAEEIQQGACAAEGFTVSVPAIARAYPVANAFLDAENAKRPIAHRSQLARDAFFTEYERRLLAAAGLDVTPEVAKRVWDRVHTTPKGLALYDDALPALKQLHDVGLTLGVISNMGPELGGIIARLGLDETIAVWASSGEAGVNKPHAAIFQLALSKAGASPHEAMHVGDSYESDVIGARNAALHPLLLWREAHGPPPEDVPVVASLGQVHGYLEQAGLL